MIDIELLKTKGCTETRLREIFTCDNVKSPDYKTRERFEEQIRKGGPVTVTAWRKIP